MKTCRFPSAVPRPLPIGSGSLKLAFAAFLLACLPGHFAKATTAYWDTNSNNTWNYTTAVWSPNSTGGSDTTFTSGQDVIFSSGTINAATLTITTGTGLVANSVTFDGSSATAYTFTNANALTIGNATTGNTVISMAANSGAVTFQGAITLVSPSTAQTYTITNNSGNLLTFGSTFTETYAPGGTAANNTITIAFNGTGGVTFNGAIDGNSAGNPGGSVNLNMTGSQTLNLNATNNSEGSMIVNATSTLNVGAALALQDYNLQMVNGSTVNFTNGITSATIAGLGGTGGTLTLTNNASAAVNLTLEGASLGNGNAPENTSPTSATNIAGLGSVTIVGVTSGGNNPNGGTETLTGVLSFTGAGGLNIANTGSTGPGASTGNNTMTLVLQGVDTYTGPTLLPNGGTLTVNSGGSIANSSAYTIQRGTFNLSPAAGNTADMLNTSGTVTLNAGGTSAATTTGVGSAFNVTGNTTNSITETFASLAIGSGNQTITLTPGTGTVTTLSAGAGTNSFIRSANGTAFIRGGNLGEGSTSTSRFLLGDGGASLTLIGSAALLSNASSSDATQALKIVPYLFGDASASGNGSNFVTYDSTLGLRVLTSSEDTTLAAGSTTAANPVNAAAFNGTISSGAGLTVNSLIFSTATQTLNGSGGALTINSGAVAATANTEVLGSGFSSLTLLNGEGVIYADSGDTLTINAPVNITGGTDDLIKTGAGTLTLGGVNLYTGPTNIYQGTLSVASTGSINAGSAITVLSGGALTNAGTVGVVTDLNGGTLNIVGGSTTGTISDQGALNFNNTTNTAFTTGAISGTAAAGAITYSNTLAAGNTLSFAAGSNSFASLTNSGASDKLILTGVGSTNTFANNGEGNTASSTTVFQSGTYIFNAGGASGGDQTGTLNITGGTAQYEGRYFDDAGATINVSAGTLQFLNSGNGASDRLDPGEGQTANSSVIFNISGTGLLNIDKTQYGTFLGSQAGASNGGTGGNVTKVTINQSGGTYQNGVTTSGGNTNNAFLQIGNATATGTYDATYNLSGGQLTANTIQGGPTTTGGTNSFNWTGGTLTFGTYTATNLTDNDGISAAATGTLFDGGGILAPGFVGAVGSNISGTQYTGKAAITGNLQIDAGGIAINIGGTTAAGGIQTVSTDYDNISVSGATVLGGKLNVGLLSYTPPNNVTQLYNILVGSASGISGNFTNLETATSGNARFVFANGLSSMLVATNKTGSAATTGGLTSVGAYTVALGGYQSGNLYTSGSGGLWDAANAASWTNFDPGSTSPPSTVASGAIADFADGGSTGGAGTNGVTLNSTRNIQGILFNSSTNGKSYSISTTGVGSIILDNTGNSAAATINDSSVNGQDTIAVPITLNSNLNVSVTNAAAADTISGIISGAGKTLTLSGAGTLNLTGANTYSGLTTVSSGALNVTGTVAGALTQTTGTTTVGSGGYVGGALTVNAGAATVSGAVAGSLTLNAGSATVASGGSVAGTLTLTTGTATVASGGTVTGAATVNGGALNANGLLSNTVTIGAAGALTGSGTIGGLLTLNAGASTINLVNGAAATLTLGNGLTLYGGNNLDFDLGSTTDTINVTGGSYAFSGSNDLINISKIVGSTVTSGTYNLITGATGISASKFTLETGSLGALNFSLATSGNSLELIAASSGLANAFWNGAFSSTWTTSVSGSTNWNTDASSGINANGIPTAVTDVYFAANGVTSPINTTLGANFTIESLNVLANAGTVTIGGSNSLTLEGNSGIGGINVAAGNSVTLNPETTVILGSSQTWTNNSALLSVQSTVTDSGSGFTLTTSGTGITVLSGSNSYSGNILAGGELSVSSDSNLGGANNSLTFSGGALQVTGTTLQSFGSHTVAFTSGSNVGLDINNAANVFTVSQVMNQGAGGLTLYGPGAVILTASSTYSGATTIYAGTLQLGTGVSGSDGSIASTSSVLNNGALIFDNTNTQSVAGGVSGAGSVSAIGTGTATLAGVNSFTGGITVNPGATLSLTGNSTAVTGNVLVGIPAVAGVSTLNLGSATQTSVNGLTIAAANTVQLGNTSGTETGANMNVIGASGFATTVLNSGTLALDRGATLTLNANSTWTQNGSMQLDENGGYSATLNVNAGASFTYAGSTPINFTDVTPSTNVHDEILVNGGTFTTGQGITFNQVTSANAFNGIFELTGGGTLALSASIAPTFFTQGTVSTGSDEFLLGTGGGIINTGGYNTTFAAPVFNVSGQSGSLTVTGGGTLALTSTANTFSGGLTVANGDLQIGTITNASTVGETGSNTSITLGSSGNTGALEYLNTVSGTTNMPFSLATGGTGAFLVDSGGGTGLTLSGTITGGGSLVKNGPGTLTITTGNNVDTYTGGTIINSGTVALTGAGGGQGVLAGTPTITVNSGGALLLLSSVNDELGYTVGKDALVINSGGTVTNNGSGMRQTLENTVTMTGGTLSGTSVGDSNTGAFSWAASPALVATSDASGNAATISARTSLEAAAATFNVTRGTAVSGTSPDLVVSGVISEYGTNTYSFTKTGNGIALFTAANTYSGATVVNGGELQIGNGASGSLSGSSAITVTSGTLAFDQASASTANNTISNSAIVAGVEGAGTTNTLGGIISGTGVFVQSGAGTTALTGVNTYTGSTTVGNGTLQLGSGGSLAGTTVTVGGVSTNATLQVNGNYTMGTSGTAGLVLTANTGTISLLDNSINTLTISGSSSSLVLGGSNTINLEINGSTADEILLAGSGQTATVTGTDTINLTALGTITSGTDVLISAAGGGLQNATFTLGTLSGAFIGTEQLIDTGTTVAFVATSYAVPGTAYFSGAYGNAWNTISSGSSVNFNTDATSNINTNQLPGSVTNVHFYTSTPAASNLSTVLGQNFTINSLTIDGTATGSESSPVSIGGTNVLTIVASATNGNTLGNGINVGSGAGALTITSAVALGGSNTWTNNSSNAVTVSGTVTGGFALTTSGAGTIILAAADGYTGATGISAGSTLQLGAGGTVGSLSTSSAITDNGNLFINRSNAVTQGTDFSAGIGGAGSVTWSGPGTLTLNAANTFSGGLVINSGTVSAITNAGALGGGSVGVASGSNGTLLGASLTFANPISFNGGGTLTLGQTAGTNNTPTFTGGATGTGNLVFNDTGTGTLTVSTGVVNNGGTIANNSTGTGQVTLSANLGSSVGVVTENSATSALNLTGSNAAWSGGLTIAQGTVNINTTNDAMGTGTLTLGAAASSLNDTLAYSNGGANAFAYSNAISVLGTGTNTISTASGPLTDSGNVTLNNNTLTLLNTNGAGTNLTLSGTTTGTGNLLLTAGGGGAQFVFGLVNSTGNVTLNSTGGNSLTVSGSLNNTNVIINSGAGTGTATISNVTVGNNVTQVIEDSTTSQLTDNATAGSSSTLYVVEAGTLNANISNGAGYLGNAAIMIGSSNFNATAVLNVGGGNGTNAPNNFITSGTGSNKITSNGSGSMTFLGSITLGVGSNLTIDPTTNNSYTMTGNVTGGAAGAGNGAALILTNAQTAGKVLLMSGSENFIGTITNLGGTAAGGASQISGRIGSGVTSITQNSTSNALLLSGSNSAFAGSVAVTSGSLRMGNASALNVNNAVTVTAGTFDLSGFGETIGSLSDGGVSTGIVTNTGASATLTLGGSATNTFSGAITGSLGFTVAGSTIETLTGSSSYTGLTTINSGATLQLGTGATGHDGTILSSSGITDNGTLVYDRFGNLSSGVVISGSGTVTISGPGSQTFTAADTYNGATTINAGATLQLGNGVSSSSDGSIANSAVTDNGTLVYNYAGAITASGTVNGTGNVTVAGPGSLKVNSSSNLNYSGTTNVSGTVIVIASGGLSGSLPNTSAVNIATGGVIDNDGAINNSATVTLNGGTLEGQGTVGSIVANSGTLAAGAGTTNYDTLSAGPLTANGNVSLSGSATFSITLGVASAGDNNSLAASGTASLAGNLQLVLGSAFSDASGGGYLNMVNVILTDGALQGTFAQGSSITVFNSANSMYDTFEILYNVDGSGNLGDGGTDVGVELISAAAIPEPGTWAMILSGAGMLLVAQRARRRSRNRLE